MTTMDPIGHSRGQGDETGFLEARKRGDEHRPERVRLPLPGPVVPTFEAEVFVVRRLDETIHVAEPHPIERHGMVSTSRRTTKTSASNVGTTGPGSGRR